MGGAAWQAQGVAQPDAPPAVRSPEKTSPVRRASLVAWVCLFIVWVVWGSTYLAIKVGVETMPPHLPQEGHGPTDVERYWDAYRQAVLSG